MFEKFTHPQIKEGDKFADSNNTTVTIKSMYIWNGVKLVYHESEPKTGPVYGWDTNIDVFLADIASGALIPTEQTHVTN